jgi:hypothetical protein
MLFYIAGGISVKPFNTVLTQHATQSWRTQVLAHTGAKHPQLGMLHSVNMSTAAKFDIAVLTRSITSLL